MRRKASPAARRWPRRARSAFSTVLTRTTGASYAVTRGSGSSRNVRAQHGISEQQLLTGDTATKVRSAALAAVPGGTIERVENDAEGSPYEAHMTKADGTEVTVKVGASFTVTSIETGR